MHDWLDRYAQALGVTPLSQEEIHAVLELARDVAHGAERRFAPLSTFLAGVLAATRSDLSRSEALQLAQDAATALLDAERPSSRP